MLPLPASDFDTALVVYRHVNVEGFVTQRLNFYSVPWSYIGQVLPVRVTENEVIIYSVGLDEIARHRLLPTTVTQGRRQILKRHHPTDDPGVQARLALAATLPGTRSRLAVQSSSTACSPEQIQGKLQSAQQLFGRLWPSINAMTYVPPSSVPFVFGAFSPGGGRALHPRRLRQAEILARRTRRFASRHA